MKSIILSSLVIYMPLFCMENEMQYDELFIRQLTNSAPAGTEVMVLKKNPPLLFLRNFLSHEEAEHIKQVASERLAQSRTDSGEITNHRTSSTAFMFFDENEKIAAVVNRASKMLNRNPDQAEIQAVRYLPNQEFKPHFDASSNDLKRDGSQREISMFLYLNDLDKSAGGETEFPLLNTTVRPEKCAALIWRNIDCYGCIDGRTLHAGRPVLHGEKWGANLFFHDKTVYYNKGLYRPFNTLYRKIWPAWNYLKNLR